MFHENIINVLTSAWFRDIGVTLLSMGISVFAKIQSRNDKYGSTSWSDYAVGIDLAVSALILLVVKSLDHYVDLNRIGTSDQRILKTAHLLAVSLSCLFALTILTWLFSAFIRRWGWKNKNKLYKWSGVTLPNFIGGSILACIVHFF
jgi:hypothetical protein